MSMATELVNLADYIGEDNGMIEVGDLDFRIDELTDIRAECEEEGVAMDAGEAAELAVLQAFKAETRRAFGVFLEDITIVREQDLSKYLRWSAEEHDGISSENVGDFVDWDRYADNQRGRWMELYLGGVKVLVSDCA